MLRAGRRALPWVVPFVRRASVAASAPTSPSWGSSAIMGFLLGGTAFAGYNLVLVATEWPAGCQAIMERVESSAELRAAFGEPISAGWQWDGAVSPTEVSVRIPVSGPKGTGVANGMAVLVNNKWVVLMCEVRVNEAAGGDHLGAGDTFNVVSGGKPGEGVFSTPQRVRHVLPSSVVESSKEE